MANKDDVLVRALGESVQDIGGAATARYFGLSESQIRQLHEARSCPSVPMLKRIATKLEWSAVQIGKYVLSVTAAPPGRRAEKKVKAKKRKQE